MEEKKWFLLSQGLIRGPFDQQSLEAELPQTQNPLIWGRGQAEWVNPEKWHRFVHDQEMHSAKARQNERLWRIRLGDQELRPMTYDQMIETLKDRGNYNDVWIWTEGYSEWRDVFQIHKVMDELGVGRRAHPRVPIAGQVLCEGTTGSFVARALSISEGGLGITEAPTIKIGEKFKVVLKSPNLFAPIHATAEVVYVGQDGYAGMKFIGLQTESKSSIIEYVRKFLENKPIPKG
jgi:hypothetical protein